MTQRSETNALVEIVDFAPAHQEAFKRLNVEWIEQHWVLEEADRLALDHPDRYILEPGGHTQRLEFTLSPTGRELDLYAHDDGNVPQAAAKRWAKRLRLGPAAMGGILMMRLSPERTPVGPSVAPRVADLLALIDAQAPVGLTPGGIHGGKGNCCAARSWVFVHAGLGREEPHANPVDRAGKNSQSKRRTKRIQVRGSLSHVGRIG